jgi:hypothetical protein
MKFSSGCWLLICAQNNGWEATVEALRLRGLAFARTGTTVSQANHAYQTRLDVLRVQFWSFLARFCRLLAGFSLRSKQGSEIRGQGSEKQGLGIRD